MDTVLMDWQDTENGETEAAIPTDFFFFLPKEQWSLYCFLYLLQSWNEALLYTVFFGYFIYSLIYYHLFIIFIIIIIYFFYENMGS